MNDRPTPETDAAIVVLINEDSCCGIEVENANTGEYVTDELVPVTLCRKLERERDELRELYDLDTQTLRAERDEARAQNQALRDALQTIRDEAFGISAEESALENIAAIEKGIADLRKEYWALRDALRVRIYDRTCSECGVVVTDDFSHRETCRHYQIEQDVTNNERNTK